MTNIDPIMLNIAKRAVQNKEMSPQEAAMKFNIPIFVLVEQTEGDKSKDLIFGMDNFEKNRGFAAKYRGDIPQDFTISLSEIYEKFGKTLSDKEKARIKQMFENIAGEDEQIDAKELKSYFEKLDKAAKKDQMLSHSDVLDFAEARGEYDRDHDVHGIIEISDPSYHALADKFITALVRTYDAKKSEFDSTSYDYDNQLTIKKYPDSKLADSPMTNITKAYDNAGRLVYETYDLDGESVKIAYTNYSKKTTIVKPDKTSVVTEKYSFSDKPDFTYYDKNGNKVKYEFGDDVITWPRTSTYKYNDGSSTKTTYICIGDMEVVSKNVYKDSDGEITHSSELFHDDKCRLAKQVHRNGDGFIEEIITHTYNKNGDETRVVKTQDGKIREILDYKNDRMEYYDTSGRLVCVSDKNGSRDANGNKVSFSWAEHDREWDEYNRRLKCKFEIDNHIRPKSSKYID